MKRSIAVLAVALISTGAVAQVAGQAQYYGADGAPSGSSMTYGNTTQYYGANGAPAGSVTYSQPVYPADYQQSIRERTTSQNASDTAKLFQDNGMGQRNSR